MKFFILYNQIVFSKLTLTILTITQSYNSFSAKRHIISIHEKKKPYKCPRCDKCFAQQGHINGHVRAVHEGIKDHKCPLCEYRCTTKQQINSHLLAVHEGVKQYKCSWCEACFSAKHCLEGHIATGQFLLADVFLYHLSQTIAGF
jgi:uncharacterized Zn-finger protein